MSEDKKKALIAVLAQIKRQQGEGAIMRMGQKGSIVAIDAKTGKYRWHFQQVKHDIWDYDATNPVVLFDLEVGGRMRKAVAEASKTGWVYILDRTNGRPLVGIEDRAVPQEPRQATARRTCGSYSRRSASASRRTSTVRGETARRTRRSSC